MTRFNDGPARGQTLMLKRTPIFLRVTEQGGKFDALSDLEDTALPAEKLYAYELAENKGRVHINAGRRSGFYNMVSYKLIEPQPADSEMRDNDAWTRWVEKRCATCGGGHPPGCCAQDGHGG